MKSKVKTNQNTIAKFIAQELMVHLAHTNTQEEEAGRAALRAHQERAGASTKSNNPVIVRNK